MMDEELRGAEVIEVAEYEAAHEEIKHAEESGQPAAALDSISNQLIDEFSQAEQERRDTELRWLKDLRQFKGQYDPEVLANIGPSRSKAFVRKTRVKVKTINSRVADLLFPAGSEKNWQVEPTPKPNIDEQEKARIQKHLQDAANQQAQAMAQAATQAGQPAQIQPQKVTPEAVDQAILASAKESAKKMATTIDDQLTEARYKEESLKAVNNCHLYGTGILKGPLVERKIRTRFRHEVVDEPVLGPNKQPILDATGNPQTRKVQRWTQYSESYVVPFVESVPLWNFYPDMSATTIDDCRFVYELHAMPRHKLAELAKRPTFHAERINAFIKSNPKGATARKATDLDTELKSMGERDASQKYDSGSYEVLERWGWIDGCDLKECGVEVPADREHESFFANIWMLPNGEIIRAVLQPINGVTWPYYFYYFDKDETSIFGEGLGAIMRDDQEMLNAATRMMLDNAAITAGPQLEVATDLLSTMERYDEVVPWKVWKRNASKAGNGQRAVNVLDLPSHLPELSSLAQMFEANADETTAIPRYMSGENATQGAAGTAAGMSMLMAAANIVIKDLINSWDEGVMRPFITAMYHWNMQFSSDNTIKGDYDVKARGTASLIAKEVRARQLNEFAQLASDPQDAPFIKRHKLLQARAEANEMSDVVKTEDEVKAEQESEQGKKQRELQEQLAQAQVEEQINKAKRLAAEAELATKRALETDAKTEHILKNIEKVIAETVAIKVEAIYAGLQAGGVATRDPLIAPAGDEVLKSAGFKDENGDPSIAQLNGPPVQQQQATQVLLNNRQAIVNDPRVAQQQGNPTIPAQAEPAEPMDGQAVDINQPSPNIGQRAGIETERIEG